MFSARAFDREYFEAENARRAAGRHDLVFYETRLTPATATLAADAGCVCVFVNDQVDADVLTKLERAGTRLVALRSAGFNHVDLDAAVGLGMTVSRVPAYSPHAVAEHTIALILTLNRRTHKAYARVREGNFSLEGLTGFDLFGATVGVVGTGKIGRCVVAALRGFGCRVLAYDLEPHPDVLALGAEYVPLDTLLAASTIVTLHVPLTPETRHMIDAAASDKMPRGVMLINTGRGALVDTRAAIAALKDGRIGYLGLDVYEEEEGLFFDDHSSSVIQDDVFARLLTFPNVLVTGHQAFLTREALQGIAATTLANVDAFEAGRTSGNELTPA
jgi:D-lactate dehydrogenase